MEVARPFRHEFVVQPVQLSQVHEDRRVGTTDRSALDLREVGVRHPGALLDLPKAESLVLSGTTEDVPKHRFARPRSVALDPRVAGFGPVAVPWDPGSWLVSGHDGTTA